jgi:glucose dehydrogenase
MSRNRFATVPHKRSDRSNAPLKRRGIVDGRQRTEDLRTYNQEHVGWGEPAKERHVRVEWLACVVVLSITTGAAYAAGPTQAELNDAVNDGTNWPYVDRDYHGQRYTPLNQLTAKNVADLVNICSFHFPEKAPAQTAPIVYDGILYATTAHYTVALDGANCKVVWQSEWKPRDQETFVTQLVAASRHRSCVRAQI